MLTLDKIYHAAFVLRDVARRTDLIAASRLNSASDLYLKTENLQVTGSFKVRGAYYKISTLTDEERNKGLVTASAGNHAQGVAYAAKCYGCKATIVMPTTTPLLKVNRTKDLGAEVILHGDVYDEACAHALDLAAEHGYTFVHPFDDPTVATGQGTIAMDIFKELPTVDYILVPIGGGGLATGVSTLAKLLNPKIKVIGVEPAGAACMKASLEADELRRRGGDGGEYGATTGRPRRMGWFDCVASKYGCRLQGTTDVAFTVLDVLGYLDEIPVCTGYEIDGKVTTDFPTTTLLEKAKPALRCIRENLRYTKLDKKAQVLATDVNSAIRQLETKNVTFDHIFMDPPYKKGFEEEVLSIIDRSSICTEDTVVIVESSLDTEIPDFEKLKVIRVKEYKTNKHTCLMKTAED